MKRLLSTFITIFPLILSAQSTADSLINNLNNVYENSPIKGFAIALVDQDGVFFKQGFGFADVENQRPYTTSTFQPIGSISKTLLGVSLAKAQELGLLNLDDDINKYLPFELSNPKHSDQAITVRHLATHTSSIKDTPNYEKAYIFSKKLDEDQLPGLKKEVRLYNSNERVPLVDFLKKIYTKDGEWYSKKNFRKDAPGESYQYSNNGAALASLVVEQASGMAYDAFVKKHILDPLEMNISSWKMTNIPADKRASLYVDDLALPNYELITYADGGFVTCIDEFSKYFVAILRGHMGLDQPLLSDESIKEILSPHYDSEERPGIFWVAGDKRIGHTGGDPGVITLAFFNRKDPVGIIIFSNTTPTKGGTENHSKLFKLADQYIYKIRNEVR